MVDLVGSSAESIERVFSPTGLLSRFVKGYEIRHQQKEMALKVMEAYDEGLIILAEAATGVGKSWAYLTPALLWAAARKGPTVVSTHTIALQEQLIKKDIPFLLKVLGLDLEATLVKGMGNYFCFRKHEELMQEKLFLSAGEQLELEQLGNFSETSQEGSLSDVNFPLSSGIWEKVSAERSSCTHVECPHFKSCFFFKARKQLAESQILIVNHHLLVADLAARLRPDFQEEKSVLPKFSRIVIDEAHHLEEIALESFSVKIDRLDLARYLGRLYSDIQPHKSRLGLLKGALSTKRKKISSELALLLDVEIPTQKRSALIMLDQFFEAIEDFCDQELVKEQSSEFREKRWRFSAEKALTVAWKDSVKESFSALQEEWKKLFSLLEILKKETFRGLVDEERDFFSSHFTAIEIVGSTLNQRLAQMEQFVLAPSDEKRVRWIEAASALAMKNTTLVDARLNVSEHLKNLLFSSKETAVLCSATLTSNQNFAFLKQQIGLEGKEFEKRVVEKTYESPFDFQKNALFLVPNDIAFSHEPDFFNQSILLIKKIIRASGGGCFLLFTSYEMLLNCYEKIVKAPDSPKFTYLKQGDLPRQTIVERFKQKKDSVLFATSSFWEGIDIAGDALRCVVLMKLPFRVPSDPLFQAMSEMYEKEGKDPFSEYSLPQACLKFKQGFGRLIRTKNDRGCVVCLDKRVMTKSYGKVFIKSLPPCPVIYKSSLEVIGQIEKFFLENEVSL